MDTRRRIGIRVFLASAVAVLPATVIASPAGAHGADESTKTVEFSQQAIAYLVNEPDNLMAAEEKVDDALEASDPLVLGTAIALDVRILIAFERRRVH